MSTRSMIGVKNENGSVTAVYCHWDGYPSWVGKMLVENYNTLKKANDLIALGDLSSLRERLAPDEGEKHTFDSPVEDVTIAYHRDRGEKFHIHNYKAVKEYKDNLWRCSAEYGYLFVNGEWKHVGDGKKERWKKTASHIDE